MLEMASQTYMCTETKRVNQHEHAKREASGQDTPRVLQRNANTQKSTFRQDLDVGHSLQFGQLAGPSILAHQSVRHFAAYLPGTLPSIYSKFASA